MNVKNIARTDRFDHEWAMPPGAIDFPNSYDGDNPDFSRASSAAATTNHRAQSLSANNPDFS